MQPGGLAARLADFAAHLSSLGYSDLTIAGYEGSARHFSHWLSKSGIELKDVDHGVIERFARHGCHCPGGRQQDHLSSKYVKRARRFVGFLAEGGLVPYKKPVAAARIDNGVVAFQDWLRQHRGICEKTIDRHGRMVTRLLPALGNKAQNWNAQVIRDVIIAETKRASIAHVKTMTTALRGYLRFLSACGHCRPGLEHAVPTIPQWRLSALPLYISVSEVERLLATCDLATASGARDRAVLLLLARLGLRAGDIVALHLSDIDWQRATLSVRGKNRRQTRLPLPQDAGDAVLAYLNQGRPRVDSGRIFHNSKAPFRPLSASTVSAIVRCAIRKAGISAPTKGANLLRHSAATAMLRDGATLDAVSAMLRHQSPDMTAHYAKIDVKLLERIAQPWPGDA
jgi:site-specific recombinase XerD